MSTYDLLRDVGLMSLLTTLALALAVLVLRLVALPLAVSVLVLDSLADVAARPLADPALRVERRTSR